VRPKVAILDEIDSGLDIDALKIVAAAITLARRENPSMGIILITHYRRILQYIQPDCIHVLHNGSLIASGDATLADRLEFEGYDVFK
jgi:Fe-S cluster assembly ATP-binding protein